MTLSRIPFATTAALVLMLSLMLSPGKTVGQTASASTNATKQDPLRRENLVAWCIVPFDSQKRTPEERAKMLVDLGIKRLAYDYRAEHVPTFEDEIEQLKKNQIELTAWWFPGELNDEAKLILSLLEKHKLQPQLWITGGGGPTQSADEQRQRVVAEANRIRPIAQAAAKVGCQVGLYNHGGWFGEPENQIAIIQELRLPNVGIVYNLHHGHDQIERLPELLAKMKPYLLTFNLNGMVRHGDRVGMKIVPIGVGEDDAAWLKALRDSGYEGPIGILNHTDHDARLRLLDNLDGLEWLVKSAEGNSQPLPAYRTWSAPPKSALDGGKLFDGRVEYRQPPITIQCTAKLTHRESYNILVACDDKSSGDHWELFTHAGSGLLAAYFPGRKPDHVQTQLDLCDGKAHAITLVLEANRARLYVDGRLQGDQATESLNRPGVPGQLGIGRLVEGGLVCSGDIYSVRISRGAIDPSESYVGQPKAPHELARWEFSKPDPKDLATVKPDSPTRAAAISTAKPIGAAIPASFDADFVNRLVSEASESGHADRGVNVFASAKLACLSCHKVGKFGGSVGPELTNLGKQRTPQEIAASILWPNHQVDEKYRVQQVLTTDGELVRGFRVSHNDQQIVLRDPTNGMERTILAEDIDAVQDAPSVMPEGLAAAMNDDQRRDVLAFMVDLGHHNKLRLPIAESVLEHAQSHDPATFEFERGPLDKAAWPSWEAHVNRDRLYDFYSKQAAYFRKMDNPPNLLEKNPGLDGGKYGHWGNQNEQTWANATWNETTLSSIQCGVYHGPDGTVVPRGVCVTIGDEGRMHTCFNPDTLTYDALWEGEFLKFSSVRHGFMDGLQVKGNLLPKPEGAKPTQSFKYHGFYRYGPRVIFAYRLGDTEFLDSPWVEDGKFVRQVAPRDRHPLRKLIFGGKRQWPERIETKIELGDQQPYATDTIELPWNNPWKALIYCGDHDFKQDGSLLLCTMQGDVWHGQGVAFQSDVEAPKAQWTRFAAGLHQSLGMHIDDDGIFVLGRDQITRLHDLNEDGEADFYECFSNAFVTSTAGHDFICGLQRDAAGNFYIASGNQGIVRIQADGQSAQVVATGFRNPDGIGLYPDGTITVPCSEGEWTPTSEICAIPARLQPAFGSDHEPPFFGYKGPKPNQSVELPMVYLPRGLDNSSGGQTYVDSDRFGPIQGQMIHASFGAAAAFVLLRDEVQGQVQGAFYPIAGEFKSGVHRGNFNPVDGQLYLSGMAGWGTYSIERGCLQRVRYTGNEQPMPIGFHVHENGIAVRFSKPLNAAVCQQARNHFAQAWNYRYSAAYGSSEYSTRHYGIRGHDRLDVRSSHVLDEGKTLFLEIPELQPVNNLHLQMTIDADKTQDLYLTCHRLDAPRSDFAGYVQVAKTIQPHPIELDLAMAARQIPNPWKGKIEGARAIRMEAGKNLSFATRQFTVKAGEVIALSMVNPDVVPHNWALVKPGALQRVGEEANKLVADPEAVIRQYVPQTDDVICYTDIVEPEATMTIYFRAPETPGRYPYLCTFPGHWMVMNGEMIVEAK